MPLPGLGPSYGLDAPWAKTINLPTWGDSAGGPLVWRRSSAGPGSSMPCPPQCLGRSDIWASRWSASCGNLTGRILGLQRVLDAWGRTLSSHLPSPNGKPTDVPGALSIGALLALNPLLIPAAVQDGLEHRWVGLALKSVLDAVALYAWVRSLSPIRWSLSLLMLGVILVWQACWTAGAAALASWLQAQGVSDALMTACSLLILCSAPAIAGVRRAALANLLPTLVWIPALTFWFRGG